MARRIKPVAASIRLVVKGQNLSQLANAILLNSVGPATAMNEMGPSTLIAAAGRVRLVSRDYLTSRQCGCPVPASPEPGFVISVSPLRPPGTPVVQSSDDDVRVCRACAVKLALAILEHEVR